jgi:uncharacterized protein YqeY
MQGVQSQIEAALKAAMRSREEDSLNALRLLLTAIKVKEKELKRVPDEAEIQQVISSQIKQRRDSIEQYNKAGRGDLAGREEREIAALLAFLPEAMSAGDLDVLIDRVIAEVGAGSAKDMGRVMKALMPKVAGRAEGRLVNEAVKKKLQGW